jgi:hypothetical protein
MGGRAGGRGCAWRRDALRSHGAGDAHAAAGRGRKRQADGRPGGLGRTVARPDSRAGGQPCVRKAGRADGRAGAAAG